MQSKYEETEVICSKCCDAVNPLATKTNDPSVVKALNTAIQQLLENWKMLKDRLTDANNKAGNALDKINDLNRHLKVMTDWLSDALVNLNNLKPCAAQAHLIDVELSKAKVCLCIP